jgi:hypothetical protein
MKRSIAIAVLAALVGSAAGWVAHEPATATASHENADQVAGIAIWYAMAAPAHGRANVNPADQIGVAFNVCMTRQHLAPQAAELSDAQACKYRVLDWAHWWEKQTRVLQSDVRR